MRAARRMVVIRADGSAQIGLGHVTRALALAGGLVAAGWQAELVSVEELPAELGERASRIGVKVRFAECAPGGRADALQLARGGADLAVVDGYGFDSGFFGILVDHELAHVVLDDNGDTAATAPAMIVNQNPHARETMYDGLAGRPRLLLGLDYVLLRHEIKTVAPCLPDGGQASGVFVAMGGSDPRELTRPIVSGLAEAGVAVRVAVGEAIPGRVSLIEDLASLGAAVVRPADFASELAAAAVAVIGAGSTMWEAAYLGVPAVAVVVAPNQEAPCAAAGGLGIVRGVEGRSTGAASQVVRTVEELLADAEARSAMARSGRRSVDGAGVGRVVAAIGDLMGRAA